MWGGAGPLEGQNCQPVFQVQVPSSRRGQTAGLTHGAGRRPGAQGVLPGERESERPGSPLMTSREPWAAGTRGWPSGTSLCCFSSSLVSAGNSAWAPRQ